ncbi:MAG: hypothetical protein EAZ14_01775 [Runella slithyformis]|nr:MAG: hypothetical protein EAZ63_07510 [Runella slithyformis]TAH15522.1 MAG: hypothetical protein EAZ14_01775 [Runella slithyformis]
MESIQKLSTDIDVLIDAFQLEKVYGGPLIENWVSAKSELLPMQAALLEDIYQQSFKKVGGWNEEEIKMKLVSFLFYIANLEEEGKISTFYERDLTADINGKRLSVTCDCLVASPLGLSSPRLPYFFLQEFKRRKRTQNDPEGQMMAAMLIAQHLNNDGKPVYGAWLTGSFWEFSILKDKTYYSSYTFNSVEHQDILQIVFILKKLKELILSR